MGILKFSADAWADYLYLQSSDRKVLKRVNELIKAAGTRRGYFWM